jgi:hypothetical protein
MMLAFVKWPVIFWPLWHAELFMWSRKVSLGFFHVETAEHAIGVQYLLAGGNARPTAVMALLAHAREMLAALPLGIVVLDPLNRSNPPGSRIQISADSETCSDTVDLGFSAAGRKSKSHADRFSSLHGN